MKHTLHNWLIIPMIFLCLLLTGCEDPNRAAAVENIALAEQRLSALGNALDNGTVRNAALVTQYANNIKSNKPEMASVADIMAKETTTDGALFKHLQTRLDDIKRMQKVHSEPKALLKESESLLTALSVPVYNNALTDTVNTLADMSDGTLPRIDSMSKSEEAIVNDASDYGAGSQLIGNPAYGQWSQGSGGTSFWAWYGMYSMFSNLTGGRHVYYNDWDRRRPYSHYQDRGVYQYGSQKSRDRASSYQKSNTKSYQSSTQKGSTYAKSSGVKSRNSSGYTAPTSMGKNSGSSSKTSSYSSGSRSSSYGSSQKSSRSSYSGSFRGSSSSRSFGGGGK